MNATVNRAFQAKLEELLGERGTKDNRAVRFKDLGSAGAGMTQQTAKHVEKIAEKVAREIVESYEGANVDVAALQAQIDAAELEAQQASAAAQNALSAAQNASAHADTIVQQARDDLDVDFQTAINAAGLADTAMLAAQQARDAALGHKQDAETAEQAAQDAQTAAEQAKALAEAQALAASNSAGAAAGSASTASSKATEAEQSATAAAAQVVIAKTGAARVLPAEITDDYWRHLNSGVPGDSGLNEQVIKHDGYVTVPASDTTSVHFISQAGLPWIDGRTYRITVTARAAQPVEGIKPLVKAYLPDFTTHGWQNNAGSLPLAGTGDWETVSIEKTLPALPDPSVTQFRIGIYTPEAAQPDIDIDLRSILVEDVTSEKSAAGSASAAVQAQQAASASETAAGQQAAAAASSATTASTKAGQASTSASNAAQSETNAAGSASTASNRATAAANSATQAGNSATAASGSASTASTKATEASQSAAAAASSATTANTKAGEASTSAQQASASKTDAAGSASSAASSATAAAGSATTAGQKATAASTSASQASTHATNAGTSAAAANTAKLAAETARGQAQSARQDAVVAKDDAEGAAAAALSTYNQVVSVQDRVISFVRNPDFQFDTEGWDVTGTHGIFTGAYLSAGKGLILTGSGRVSLPNPIPFKAGKVWRLTARAKRYSIDGCIFYVGVRFIDGAGGTLGYFYPAANNAVLSGSSLQTFTGLLTASDAPAGTVAFETRLLANYQQDSTYRTLIDYFEVEDVTEAVSVDAKLTNEYMTAVQTTQAVANAKQSVEAQLGTTNATVTKNSTALTNLNGQTAVFDLVTTVNGQKQAAALKVMAWNGNGNGSGSAIVLNAMNIIAKGTLSTDALVVGLGKNLMVDPEFADGDAHYGKSGNTAAFSFGIRSAGSFGAHAGSPSLSIVQTAASTTNPYWRHQPIREGGTPAIGLPVKGNAWYMLLASMRDSGNGNPASRLYIYWRDAAGNDVGSASTPFVLHGGNGYDPNAWPREYLLAQAPSNAVYAECLYQKSGAGGDGSALFVWRPQFEESHANAQGPSPWSPGGVTSINGGRLFANSVTAREASFESLAALNLKVGRADILDLAVNTLKIDNNAVTIPVSASASSEIILDHDNERTLLTVSMVRTGAPTLIFATVQIGGYVTQSLASFRLYRNGVMVESFPSVSGSRGTQNSASFSWRDANTGTGTTSYQLRAIRAKEGDYQGNPQIVNRTLTALHVKR